MAGIYSIRTSLPERNTGESDGIVLGLLCTPVDCNCELIKSGVKANYLLEESSNHFPNTRNLLTPFDVQKKEDFRERREKHHYNFNNFT